MDQTSGCGAIMTVEAMRAHAAPCRAVRATTAWLYFSPEWKAISIRVLV
jgi:hypothetical protein